MVSAWVEEVEGFTRGAQARALEPFEWALHVSAAAGVELPSPELAELLVDHVCRWNAAPISWKYLEWAMPSNLVPPVVVVALLSTRVIPKRNVKPAAYRLYMEILKRHSLLLFSQASEANYKRDFMLADTILGLSRTFTVETCDTGVILVKFILCIIWQLVDAALEDEGLMSLTLDKRPRWLSRSNDMEIDGEDNFEEQIVEYSDKLQKTNTVVSIELIARLLRDKTISRLLSLANRNMQSDWGSFSQRLNLLVAKSSALRSSTISPDSFIPLSLDYSRKTHKKYLPTRFREFCAISSGSLSSTAGRIYGPNHSSLWIPLDLFLEDAIKGSISATNSIEVLYGLVKALQAVNRISWHDTFLSLWLAALRLVQRERLIEGPEPHVDIRMSMLLSIVTLTVADLVEDEVISVDSCKSTTVSLQKEKTIPERSSALVSCLQMLGEHEALLAPPPSIISLANQAARKAMMVVSGIPIPSGSLDGLSMDDKAFDCSGNLRHLIVEACIVRNLLDTSAYYWPGYVHGRISKIPQIISAQVSSWSALMKGVPLKSLTLSTLVNTPASSLPELEKIFEMAVNGSVDEKISATTILCGASLVRGWNFQEHTVCLVIKLLSPPIPADYSGSESHLISHGPTLNVVLTRMSARDCIQVFFLHGLVPELAGSLMPICEAFGSCKPDILWTLPNGESISAHTVFSNAFVLLLMLWKFNHSPLEFCVLGEEAPPGSKLNPDYLLFLRNLDILSFSSSPKKRNKGSHILAGANSKNSIFLDQFPKLKAWYQQHQACLASTLSGLVSGTPVCQNVDCLLNMMFKKTDSGASHSVGSAASSSGSLSNSSGPPREDISQRLRLPAWDIMESVPFVVDAALTACSCGRLSPRELVTGLKDLADFLPASLGAIVSYFTAEATRGVWKPAYMNGTDWPSPAANLSTVEEHIKKIVATTGVDVPSLVTGNAPATLPLPLAAFLSLTITYNLDKSSELHLVGPALENLATSCLWPSMPIVSALWAQKVKRWSYFLTFSSSGTVFYHNNNAVVQLLRSCFSAFLGLSNTSTFQVGGVGSLLGNGSGPNISSGLSPVAPGVLYLQIHQKIRDIMQLSEEVLSTLMLSIRELASDCLPKERRERMKNSKFGMRYGQVSLFAALGKAKSAASLGAILIWLSGGSGLIQSLIREVLPSWFLSVHDPDQGGKGALVELLVGYTLAYFVVLCGMFAWGIDSTWSSKRRPKILRAHLKFLADALDGKIVLGCNCTTWQAYITEFLGLLLDSAPNWIGEVNLDLLKRLSRGLKMLGEKELAIRLLERAGTSAMSAAVELIINKK